MHVDVLEASNVASSVAGIEVIGRVAGIELISRVAGIKAGSVAAAAAGLHMLMRRLLTLNPRPLRPGGQITCCHNNQLVQMVRELLYLVLDENIKSN